MWDAAYNEYIWITLLLVGSLISWLSNFVTLPGNWGIVLFAGLSAALLEPGDRFRASWWVVAVLLGLALLGEALEFLASLLGAAKQGGSRRAMVLSVVGAVAGGLLGVIVGLPIPIIGSFAGALIGAGGGAFLGAYIGESSLGRSHAESYAVGEQAFIGRLLGTGAKIFCGGLMLVALAVDTLFL